MKTVCMPLYENGVQLPEYLEVDIVIFERLAAQSTIYKDCVRVVPESPMTEPSASDWDDWRDQTGVKATPEQEIEMIDRFISGLPPVARDVVKQYTPRPIVTYKTQTVDVEMVKQLQYKEERLKEAIEVTLGEGVSAYPEIRHTYGDWRYIPGFPNYTMNPFRKIIDERTDLEVPWNLGRLNNVLLTNPDGIAKRMSVDFLFEKTFPELNK